MDKILRFSDGGMSAGFDTENGNTCEIICGFDSFKMNFTEGGSLWGKVENFRLLSVSEIDNGILCKLNDSSGKLSLNVKRTVKNGGLFEEYEFVNITDDEISINSDTFSVLFPFASTVKRGKENFQEKTCNAHVWCGNDTCWLYAVKLTGEAPCLVSFVKEGGFSDYSIIRDVSRAPIGADSRGDIAINPENTVIKPKASKTYTVITKFTEKKPLDYLKSETALILLSADNYSLKAGEEVTVTAFCKPGADGIYAVCENKKYLPEINGSFALFKMKFDTLGEKTVKVFGGNKQTFLKLNVIEDFDAILEKRARFIAEKQQYLGKDSHLYGAYLCFDDDTKSLFYERGGDKNDCRERMGMGITVLKALRKKWDSDVFESVKKHREFTEREIVDFSDFTVNNGSGGDRFFRLYNYPWVADYFFEWYLLKGDKNDLRICFKILMSFFEKGGIYHQAQCIPVCPLLNALEKEKLKTEAETYKEYFIRYADNIMGQGFVNSSEETGYVSENPDVLTSYLSQAYILTGDKKYLDGAEKFKKSADSFFSFQPDYHLNCINVRHWDRYWFGKYKEYGDVFPHYWSVLAAEAYYWYGIAANTDTKNTVRQICSGNLCVFRNDGFAYNNYLYPYRVTLYSSDESFPLDCFALGSFFGKRYDIRSNDQDWALVFTDITEGF